MSPFADEIRKELSRRGVWISQDCAVSAGYDLLDVAFCSAGDNLDSATAMAESAIDGGARLAVVTCGPAGSIAYDGTTWTRQHAAPIEPVDTTGAGDSFIAGFIAALASGQELQSCMQAGAAHAARNCLHWGGWPQEGQ
jgi:fructoselysine 6-kinase